MSFLKLNGSAGVALVAFAMLMASSQVALADTKTLVCTGWSPAEASPTTLDLDEAKSLVTIHIGSMHNPGGSPDPSPGPTQGPYTAQFDQNTITFKRNAGGNAPDITYTINRLTGIVSLDNSTGHAEWSCHIGKAQF